MSSLLIHVPNVTAAAKSLQSCLTLCDPIDGSPPGSHAPGILQARTLEWVAISFSNAWKWKVKVRQEEKGTEDEMAGWHHPLEGHEFEWTPGIGDGQGGLVCCDSWGRKESDMTEQLNWTELNWPRLCSWFHSFPTHGSNRSDGYSYYLRHREGKVLTPGHTAAGKGQRIFFSVSQIPSSPTEFWGKKKKKNKRMPSDPTLIGDGNWVGWRSGWTQQEASPTPPGGSSSLSLGPCPAPSMPSELRAVPMVPQLQVLLETGARGGAQGGARGGSCSGTPYLCWNSPDAMFRGRPLQGRYRGLATRG